MARKERTPKARGWYVKKGDPAGTERFWDGEKWGPQPRVKRGAEQELKQKQEPEETDADKSERVKPNEPEMLLQSTVWARISARSADMVLIVLPWYLLWIRAFETTETVVDDVVDRTTEVDAVFLWGSVAVVALYEVLFVRWWGATPGKRLVGLQIVDRESLEPPGWGRAILRTTPMVLISAIVLAPLLWLICVVAMARDRFQRSVFDFSGGTFVVLDPSRPGRLARQKRARKS